MTDAEKERIVREAVAYGEDFELIDKTCAEYVLDEVAKEALRLAIPADSVVVPVAKLENVWGCANVIRNHGQIHLEGAVLQIMRDLAPYLDLPVPAALGDA